MPNIALISSDNILYTDLASQICHYAPDYNVIDNNDISQADIIIIDENSYSSAFYSQIDVQAPLFILCTKTEQNEAEHKYGHIIYKPFLLSDFLDKINSCINLFENTENGYITFNQYTLRPMKKDIVNNKNNKSIKLTEKEVAIIKYLYKNRNRIVSKTELLQEVWGYSPDASTHTIETHIYRLGQKVEADEASDPIIETVDGGYQLQN